MHVSKRLIHIVVLLTLSVAARAEQVAKLDGADLMATVRTLASPEFEGRRAGSPGGLKAREWIVKRFESLGLAPTITDDGNVVAVCKSRESPHEIMVVSAHYDHLGIRDGRLYPGADDNASGVAVMLAIAGYCRRMPFTHDTLFVAFDAEEGGLRGAKGFVAHPPVPIDRVALDVNLDMVSRSDKRELYVAGPYHWPQTKPPLEGVAKRASIKLLFGHDKPREIAGGQDDWTRQSDHAAFHEAGIPFVYFGVEDHGDYHKPSDTADKIDPTFLREVAETILDAVIALDAELPLGRG
jgi:Zn-dependent M28 family amino/carboxypeptidase